MASSGGTLTAPGQSAYEELDDSAIDTLDDFPMPELNV